MAGYTDWLARCVLRRYFLRIGWGTRSGNSLWLANVSQSKICIHDAFGNKIHQYGGSAGSK